MITSETRGASTPARSSAALIATLPSSWAGRVAERAVERTDRRARRPYDDDVVLHHGNSFWAEVAALIARPGAG